MSKNDLSHNNIDQRALGAMLQNAFFTWPSAVNIAFFLVLFLLGVSPFGFWQPWMWIALGAVAEVIYLAATVTDPEQSRRAVEQMVTERYNPNSIRNLTARDKLKQSLDYKALIDKFIDAQGGAFKASLQQTSSDVNDWIGLIYGLAKKIDTFESNTTINQKLRDVPTQIVNLKRRLDLETDPSVKAALNELICINQELNDNLQKIGNTAKSAEIQMDNTLAQLGTVYAQMQLIDVKDINSGRTQRLRDNIREQIASLSDTISAMDDVYHQPGIENTAVSGSSVNNAINNLSASGTPNPVDLSGTQQSQSGSKRT